MARKLIVPNNLNSDGICQIFASEIWSISCCCVVSDEYNIKYGIQKAHCYSVKLCFVLFRLNRMLLNEDDVNDNNVFMFSYKNIISMCIIVLCIDIT